MKNIVFPKLNSRDATEAKGRVTRSCASYRPFETPETPVETELFGSWCEEKLTTK